MCTPYYSKITGPISWGLGTMPREEHRLGHKSHSQKVIGLHSGTEETPMPGPLSALLGESFPTHTVSLFPLPCFALICPPCDWLCVSEDMSGSLTEQLGSKNTTSFLYFYPPQILCGDSFYKPLRCYRSYLLVSPPICQPIFVAGLTPHPLCPS